MLILEQNPVLQGKSTPAASRKFPNHYYIAEESLLISNSFTNKFKVLFCLAISKCFFCFISLSVYFLRQMLIWPGSKFIRQPTRLSYAGVCVLRLAFNLMQIKFLYNKSFDGNDTFQCHLLQSLKIISNEFNSRSHKQLNSTIARLLKRIKLVW